MEKIKALTAYINDILNNPPSSVDKYEDYAYEITSKFYDIDTEFDMELVADENVKPGAEFDEKQNVLTISINPENDFHYFVYQIVDSLLSEEDEVEGALDYFTKMVEEEEMDGVARRIIAAAHSKDLSEDQEKLITGAQEYLMQMLEFFSAIDDEDKEFDALYSIKAINSLLRFADADLDELRLFEVQYDYRMLNILSISAFLEEKFKEAPQEYVEAAKEIVRHTLADIEDFQPERAILDLPGDQMAAKIAQLDYFDILQWIHFFSKNSMQEDLNIIRNTLMQQINSSLENNEWDDAFVLTNILRPYFVDDDEILKMAVLSQMGLKLFYDAYKDYKSLPADYDDHIMQFIRKEFSSLGLK